MYEKVGILIFIETKHSVSVLIRLNTDREPSLAVFRG
jgi:hypothetical protein